MSAVEVIAAVLQKAEDDAYLHGAWNSRPDPQPQDILDALKAAGYAVVELPDPTWTKAADDDENAHLRAEVARLKGEK